MLLETCYPSIAVGLHVEKRKFSVCHVFVVSVEFWVRNRYLHLETVCLSP